MRCERVRQDLQRQEGFDLEKAFETVSLAVNDQDEGEDLIISKDDISSFLISQSYIPTAKQVNLFFSRLDRFNTGRPKLSDWKQEMAPRTSEHV